MATSFIKRERIISTRAKIKSFQIIAEKLITKAKKISLAEKPEQKLHYKREIFRFIKDRDMAAKLYDDIAARYSNRHGGYTRIIHLPNRANDASKMSLIELVEYREPEKLIKSSEKKAEKAQLGKKEKKEKVKK
jgi:large subunit ribosomal protein L17